MIALGCDHGGYNLMVAIKKYLDENNIAYTDFGTDSEASVDYPVYAYKVAKAVTEGGCELGILCCGTGIGISMAANKVKGDSTWNNHKHHQYSITRTSRDIGQF